MAHHEVTVGDARPTCAPHQYPPVAKWVKIETWGSAALRPPVRSQTRRRSAWLLLKFPRQLACAVFFTSAAGKRHWFLQICNNRPNTEILRTIPPIIAVFAHHSLLPSLFRTSFGPPPWTKTDKQGRFQLAPLPDVPLEIMAYIEPKGGSQQIRFPARLKATLNQQDMRLVLDPSLAEDED